MAEQLLWAIGPASAHSPDLIDNYTDPLVVGDVVWRVPADGQQMEQQWPMYHPSEADPEAGYRLHPYTILFNRAGEPAAAYCLRIQYLVIAPRLPYLEIDINGCIGRAYLRPAPSQSGEIRLMAGLHTTIYAEGSAEVVIPGSLLRHGENQLRLVSRDDGPTIVLHNGEAIKRLDRMANGAGLIYQAITFEQLAATPRQGIARLEIKPTVVYRKRADGTLAEQCYLYVECNHAIASGSLTLSVRSGDQAEHFDFLLPATSFGHIRHNFELFDGPCRTVEYTMEGTVDGEVLDEAGRFTRCRKWQVYLTPHAHTDIGYTHRQWEVAERLCRNIDTALDLLAAEDPVEADQPPSFSYHLDSAWALETWLATRSEPRKQQLITQILARRISVPSNYVDLLTHYAALEDLVRNGEFTDALLRPHGARADFAAVVDVASLTGALPAILEGSCIRYLVHANNQDRGPFRLNGGLHRISPFFWQGVSGGRVLVWLAKMYCELRKVCGSPPLVDAAERGLDLWLQEYESDAYAPDAVLLYGQEADNTDLDPQPVAFVQQWNATYAYPRLIPADVSDFFRYVEEHFGGSLHTVTGDGGAYWEDGVASTIVPAINVRRAQAMLPAAERLEALAVVHNDDWTYPQSLFDNAWRQILVWDEHTWGAFVSCRDPQALLQQDQWATKEHMARGAVQWAQRLLHAAATRHSLSWNNNGREVVVFNPHSWPISDLIRVEIDRREQVLDAESGAPIPLRRVQELQTQAIVDLWIDALPGLSYRRLVLQPTTDGTAPTAHTGHSASERTVELQNQHYRLVFNLQDGCVVSWFDKTLDRELIDQQTPWRFGQLVYARGGEGTRLVSNQADWPAGNPELLHDFSLIDSAIEQCDFGTRLMIRGVVPFGELEVEWLLHDRIKRVDVRYTYHKVERLAKEAVYIAFPLALTDAEVCSDAQLGWVNWDKDQLPGGCKEWLPLQTGVLVSTPDAAVLLASPEVPLFCVGDVVRGRWPKELQLSGGHIFSYVLNNYWHTNYKAAQGGPISFGYQLTSDRSIATDRAFRAGWTARRPLYAQRMSYQDFRQTKAPYQDPSGGCLAVIGPQQVALSTIKQAKWADGWIVRLQEITGAAQTASIAFPHKKVERAWATDLLEYEGEELAVEGDGTLRVQVPAWGLATFRIVLAPQGPGT